MQVSVEKPGTPGELVEHSGVKGMKWGVRKQRPVGVSSRSKLYRTGFAAKGVAKAVGRGAGRSGRAIGRAIDDIAFELGTTSDRVQRNIISKASKSMKKDLPGIKAKHGDYGKLRNRIKKPFSKEAKAYRADVRKAYGKHLEAAANSMTNIQGTRRYTLKENGQPHTSNYFWLVSTEAVAHADIAEFKVRPIFDEEGWIIDFEIVDDSMEQSALIGEDFVTGFFEHAGVKGMKWGVRKHATGVERDRSIRSARAAQITRLTRIQNAPKGSKERANAKKAFLKHPDRATSLRLTRGEKVVVAILAGSVVATPTTAAALGSRVAARKIIERKQARGAYG